MKPVTISTGQDARAGEVKGRAQVAEPHTNMTTRTAKHRGVQEFITTPLKKVLRWRAGYTKPKHPN